MIQTKEKRKVKRLKVKKPAAAAIMVLILMTLIAFSSTATGTNVPFACFADGEVFNSDGTPVANGLKVNITNLDSGEVFETATGYPQYPPVEMYDNDYKSVFMCLAGRDRVSVKAWNGTHYGYGEIEVPRDSQALLNITLDKRIEQKKEGSIVGVFRKIIDYFTSR